MHIHDSYNKPCSRCLSLSGHGPKFVWGLANLDLKPQFETDFVAEVFGNAGLLLCLNSKEEFLGAGFPKDLQCLLVKA